MDETFDLPVDDMPESPPGESQPPKPAKPAKPKPAKPKPESKSEPGEGFKLVGGRIEDIKIASLVRLHEAQSRHGLGELAVDPERVAVYADRIRDMKRGGGEVTFPPVKVMLIEDGPGEYKGVPTAFLFDGFHTCAAHEAAGLRTVRARVYRGDITALRMAAALSNKEHDTNGKPRTNADKERAVRMLAKAYIQSAIPREAWPSNRQFAEMCGVSHNFVNELDPLGRSPSGPRNELKKIAKRKPPVSLPTHAAANQFDWVAYENNLAFMVRGLDAMGDTYNFKDQPEYAGAYRVLNEFSAFFAGVRRRFGAKK